MDRFIKVAQEAAYRSGEFLKDKINKVSSIKEKRGAFDIVTDADIKAQKLIVNIILANFPHHGIFAEEGKGKKELKEYTWVIDPIDGTAAFASKLPTYSSSIALLADKKPIVGAIYLAITDEVIWSARGKGAFNGKIQLRVKKTSNLRKATIGFDPSPFDRERVMKEIAAPLSDKVRILPLIWSQAAALALIAKGIFDGYIQCNSPKVWDVAAGKLIVEEAGGIITNFSGDKVDLFNINGYVAGSTIIHRKLIEYTNIS